jgi:hypothetical protein
MKCSKRLIELAVTSRSAVWNVCLGVKLRLSCEYQVTLRGFGSAKVSSTLERYRTDEEVKRGSSVLPSKRKPKLAERKHSFEQTCLRLARKHLSEDFPEPERVGCPKKRTEAMSRDLTHAGASLPAAALRSKQPSSKAIAPMARLGFSTPSGMRMIVICFLS